MPEKKKPEDYDNDEAPENEGISPDETVETAEEEDVKKVRGRPRVNPPKRERTEKQKEMDRRNSERFKAFAAAKRQAKADAEKNKIETNEVEDRDDPKPNAPPPPKVKKPAKKKKVIEEVVEEEESSEEEEEVVVRRIVKKKKPKKKVVYRDDSSDDEPISRPKTRSSPAPQVSPALPQLNFL